MLAIEALDRRVGEFTLGRQVEIGHDFYGFEGSDLIVCSGTLKYDKKTIGDNPLILKKGSDVAVIGFSKGYSAIEILRRGYMDLRDYFIYVDSLSDSMWPRYLYGLTNRRMANFAVRRLGFKHVESDFPFTDLQEVIAEAGEVRQRFDEISRYSYGDLTLDEYFRFFR